MSEEFKREVRYVVTKIKTGKQVTCVVVEEDWPEYENVWRMIQDRMEGRPNELEQLRARNAELERQFKEMTDERDKQARLNGMGSERETALMEKVAELERKSLVYESELEDANEKIVELERKIAESKKELSSIDYIGDVSIGIKVLKNTLEASKEANEKSYESFKQMAKRAEQAEQRIAESQRPQYGFVPEFLRFTQRPCGCHYAEYELQLTDCGGEFSGKAPNLYCAPIAPPTVEEAVKAEREACAKICDEQIRVFTGLVDMQESKEDSDHYLSDCFVLSMIAKAIRERNDK